MDIQFASVELELLYTENAGAEKYAVDTVTLFRRRIRHIEAAKDLRDLRCLSSVKYKKLSSKHPNKSSLALNADWMLVISEQHDHGTERILVHEIVNREEN